jgi:Ca2+-binding EF-hand superfamily protein
VALDGFEVDALNPGEFKDLVRRVFNLTFTSTELGYIVQKYDVKRTGTVHSKTFLIDFLRLGQEVRHKMHSEQLDKQRKLDQQAVLESLRKIKEIQNSETIKIDDTFSDNDLKSGLEKLTKAAMFHDSERGASLISFEPASITPLEFKKALKRTFNITLTPAEMGAMVTYFDKDRKNEVNCQAFLTKFVSLGAEERGRVHLEQLNACRDAEKRIKEDHIKKITELASKTLNDVDFDYSMEDLKTAQEKTRIAAAKYDAGHPAAPGLEGFDCKFIRGGEFRELVRRTFHLKLTPKEVGAIFGQFETLKQLSKSGEVETVSVPTPVKPTNRGGITGRTTARDAPVIDALDCGEFLNYFLQTGISERAKVHSQQLEKQRREDKERLQEEERKVKELTTRNNFEPDRKFTDEDKESIMEKLLIAAEGFDK